MGLAAFSGICILVGLLLAGALGCSSGAAVPGAPPSGQITVFAASSLTNAFNGVKTAFEAANPGVTVIYNFGGSPTLRTQLEQGAKADVFASADEVQMNQAVQSGVIGGAITKFATNRLVVITPADGASVSALADLAKPSIKLVLALPDVPAGNYARQSLAKLNGAAGLPTDFRDRALANVVSGETNVRQVVSKVSLGEADAGIVYATDVTAEVKAKLKTIAIPDTANVLAIYPVALVKGSGSPDGARAFIALLSSPQGQRIMTNQGFGPAP